ncbi:hypothetical protein F2P81_018404 [Scophthalmus maximus]|uniref:Dynactin subunit 6 n=1 Tax=Scophthalmus maximus TaxID=52904 RepID=A0A6A4S9Q5_SCOMX|nr:hypothetical protein F2P81_018404 [Scophthalmus maximus]
MSDASKQIMAQKSAKIAAGAVVCVESEIRGDVTIGARTVVHPKARIIAEAGPIIIGEGNLIEEQALIINSGSWEKCDSDQWLHRRCVLPGQRVRGRAREHGCVRFELHQARAERKAAAANSAARLPHEDSAQLPPPEEDGEGKRHAREELARRKETCRDTSAQHRTHTFPPICTCLTFSVAP